MTPEDHSRERAEDVFDEWCAQAQNTDAEARRALVQSYPRLAEHFTSLFAALDLADKALEGRKMPPDRDSVAKEQ